jgi:hypothetical protein
MFPIINQLVLSIEKNKLKTVLRLQKRKKKMQRNKRLKYTFLAVVFLPFCLLLSSVSMTYPYLSPLCINIDGLYNS